MANIEARYKGIRKGISDHVTLVAAAKTRTVEELSMQVLRSLGRTMFRRLRGLSMLSETRRNGTCLGTYSETRSGRLSSQNRKHGIEDDFIMLRKEIGLYGDF